MARQAERRQGAAVASTAKRVARERIIRVGWVGWVAGFIAYYFWGFDAGFRLGFLSPPRPGNSHAYGSTEGGGSLNRLPATRAGSDQLIVLLGWLDCVC